MSASAVQDSIADFGALAFEAIHKLNAEIRELREELEQREKECDLLAAALDRLDPDRSRR